MDIRPRKNLMKKNLKGYMRSKKAHVHQAKSRYMPTSARGKITFLLTFFLASINVFSQTDTISSYTNSTNLTSGGASALAFEIVTNKHLHIREIAASLLTEGPTDIYFRVGGVGGSPSISSISIDNSNGWTLLGSGNPSSLGNPLTSIPFDLDLLVPPGTYGFAIDPTTAAMKYQLWDSTVTDVFANGTVSLFNGPGKGYGGAGSITNLDRPNYQFIGELIYDAFIPIANDISLTKLELKTYCAGNNAISATVRNLGSNLVNSLTLNWSIDNVTQTPVAITQLLDTIGGLGSIEALLPLGNINMLSKGSYDIKIWSSLPNGNTDGNPSNDTIYSTIYTAMSGSYTINPSGSGLNNFTSVKGATKALSQNGVCGQVVFDISPGLYTENIFLEEINGSSAANTITFNGGDTSLVELTYSSTSDTATIFLLGTKYINFKNMTIANTSSSDAWGLMLQNNTSYISIDSCHFNMEISSSTDKIAIIASSSKSGESSGENAEYVSITNNTFIGGESAITLDGPSSTPYSRGHSIKNNIFRHQDDHAIDIDGANSLEIIGNDADSLTRTSADAFIILDVNDYNISYNRIICDDLTLDLGDANEGYTVTSRSIIANNMIISETDNGMDLDDIKFTNIYHNSVKGNPAAEINDHEEIDIRNNIFYSDNGIAFGTDNALKTGDIVDYNLYYSGGSATLEIVGTNYSSLLDWRAVEKGFNLNSLQGDPFFISSNDLHVNGWFANDRADATVNITDDIDGETRGSAPDIGADQYNPDSAQCFAVTGLVLENITGTTATVSFDRPGATYSIEWGPCGFTQGSGTTIANGVSPIVISSLSPETCYDVYVQRFCGGVYNGPFSIYTGCSAPLSGTYTINSTLPSGSTNFMSFKEVEGKLNTCGINGPVIFNVAAGNYIESITLLQVSGNSSTSTITFNGTDTSNTIITDDGSVQNSIIELVGTDYVTINKLKIINTKTSNFSWGIHLSNEADNVSITDCSIRVGDYGISAIYQAPILGNGSGNSIFTGGNFGDNITVTGNVLRGGLTGVKFQGPSGAYQDSNVVIKNNVFQASGTGVELRNVTLVNVSENLFDSTNTCRSAFYMDEVVQYKINNNIIYTLEGAMNVNECDFDAIPSVRSEIVNNVIVSSSTEVEPTTQYAHTAISLQDTRYVDVYHNSIRNSSGSATATFVGLSFDDLITEVNIKNNVFSVEGGRALYSTNALTDPTVEIDHNCFYNTSADLIEIFTNSYTDLIAWQLADASRNLNSVSGDPLFVSSTDLHASSALLNNSGDSLGIISDFDGDIRSQPFPDMGVDEFALPCLVSSNAIISNITLTSADLSWTAGTGTRFNIQYDVTGFVLGAGNIISAVNNPYTLSSLSPATTYDFYIQDSCGTEGASAWVGPFTFTTLTPAICNISTSLGAFNITTGSADIFWTTGGAANWNVEYGPTGFTQGNGTLIYDTQNDTIALSNLVGGNCYDFYVQDSCSSTQLSLWAGPYNFCTSACPLAGQDSTILTCESETVGIDIEAVIGNHSPLGVWDYGTATPAMVGSLFFPSVAGPGTFELVYSIDTIGCGKDSSVVTFIVGTTVNIGVNYSSDTICDTLIIDLSTYLGTHTPGGTWKDINNSGGLTGSLLDLSQVANSFTYRYEYYIAGVGACEGTATIDIYVDFCSIGLNEGYKLNDISIYPNPARDVLNISFTTSSSKATVELFDLSGKQVARELFENINGEFKSSLNVKELAKGTYNLRIESKGTVKNLKVIIN